MNNLELIELIDSHIEKVHDFMFKTSDIIRIMDFIMNEANKLDREAKTIVDTFDDSFFFLLSITDSLDKLKNVENGILEITLDKVKDINEDFTIYLDMLSEKRIINNLDKVMLLSFTDILMNITFANSYTNYMTKRIDEYKSKVYRK